MTVDERLCPDGKRHFWDWHGRSFDLPVKAGDAQVCNRCGQARLLDEKGDARDHAVDLDALFEKWS